MMRIKRFLKNKTITLGILSYGESNFYTVELPWKNNQSNISCIPDGTYPIKKVDSPSHGKDTWRIMDVCNRTYIDLHVGNVPADFKGCVGLGLTVYPDLRGVGSSRIAMDEFAELTKGIKEDIIIITTEAIT